MRTLALVLAMCLVAFAIATGAGAHPDKPGPPAISTEVDLEQVVFQHTDFRDGHGSAANPEGAEFILQMTVEHEGHEIAPPIIREVDDQIGRFWSPEPITIYTHSECTGREDIIVSGHLVEIDRGFDTATFWAVTGAALRGAVQGATQSRGPWQARLAVGAAGLVGGLLSTLNANDDWGTFGATLPGPENAFDNATASGEAGAARLSFLARSEQLEGDTSCDPAPSPSPTPIGSVGQRASLIFPPLKEALAVNNEQVESGNPGGLTTTELARIDRTLDGFAIGTAEALAAAAIEDARGSAGAENAVATFGEAQVVALEDPETAIQLFESAWIDAVEAFERAEPTNVPTALPLQVILLPDYIATERGRHVDVIALVAGAGGNVELSVGDAAGIDNVSVAQADAALPVFEISFDIVRSGAIVVPVTALTGGGTVEGAIELDASPPLPQCFGKRATLGGTGADEAIEGTSGNDVIVGSGGDDEVNGRGGDDLICGNGGEDTLLGGSGNDKLSGGAGSDHLEGGSGQDICRSGRGRDRVLAGGPDRCEKFS